MVAVSRGGLALGPSRPLSRRRALDPSRASQEKPCQEAGRGSGLEEGHFGGWPLTPEWTDAPCFPEPPTPAPKAASSLPQRLDPPHPNPRISHRLLRPVAPPPPASRGSLGDSPLGRGTPRDRCSPPRGAPRAAFGAGVQTQTWGGSSHLGRRAPPPKLHSPQEEPGKDGLQTECPPAGPGCGPEWQHSPTGPRGVWARGRWALPPHVAVPLSVEGALGTGGSRLRGHNPGSRCCSCSSLPSPLKVLWSLCGRVWTEVRSQGDWRALTPPACHTHDPPSPITPRAGIHALHPTQQFPDAAGPRLGHLGDIGLTTWLEAGGVRAHPAR